MENIKLKKNILIFSDLDGTSLNDDHDFSETTKNMVKNVYEKGCYFIPVTARLTIDTIRQAKKLGIDKYKGFAAANNGAQIFSFAKDKFIRDEYLSNEFVEFVFNNTYGMVGKYKTHFFADNTTYTYTMGDNSKYWADVMKGEYKVISVLDEIDDKINKLTIILEKNPSKESVSDFKKLFKKYLKEYSVVVYSNRVYEFTPKKCTKDSVFDFVIKELKLIKDDTTIFSFGDGYNDIPMFIKSDYSIVMGNANDEIKSYGDFVTLTNHEDGVADFVTKNILDKLA